MPRKRQTKMVRAMNKKKLAPNTAKAVGKIVDKKIHANEEDKYFDLSQVIASGTAVTNNAGSIVLLSGVLQGVTFATRVGEMINPRKLELRIDATSFPSTANAAVFDTNFRIIVFQDRQIRTSTLPTVADVLETVAYNSPFNHVGINSKRFHILMDRWISLDPNFYDAVANTGIALFDTQTSQKLHKVIKLKSKIAYTNASTGTERNNIYILYLSDQATGTAPSINVYSRLIFEDA